MTNFKKQIITAAATGAMLLNIATPALAGTTITVSGNGSYSDNEVDIEQENKTEVNQWNEADVQNEVKVTSNTGDNKAEDNTGGNVKIDTGDSTSKVTVNNNLNSNAADVDCCQANGDTTVEVSGNGTDSDNNVWLDNENKVDVDQTNKAKVDNDVNVDSNTGDNDAEDNTGGNVEILTGDTDTTVKVNTSANSNWAKVGGSSNGGSLTAKILGNGEDSDNEIDLELENNVYLDQWNEADVENDVDVDSETGDNDADDNTGGDVIIDTGDATTKVIVDNMVNFNAADVDCGCVLDDIDAKVSGNGTDSDNEIELELEGKTDADQTNKFDCAGQDACSDVEVDSDTGDNDAEDNTGPVDSDPSIETGDADTEVHVDNSGNSNAFGVDLGDLDLPNGLSLNFSFDFGAFLDWLADQG